jgi:hypothetical protein
MIDGKAVCTPVKRGPSDDTHSIVLDGLSAGEVVVVGPFKALEEIKHDDALTIDDGKRETIASEKPANEGGGVHVRMR